MIEVEYLAVAEAYGRYRELLDEENVFDFATLQRAAYEMLRAHDRVRDEVRDRYRHILVDEYQDTNRLQVLILKEIAAPRYELCAVGDDDQSIYRFRGASVKSFLRFEEDFPGARRIDLDVNFRATSPLVEALPAWRRAFRPLKLNTSERLPWGALRGESLVIRAAWRTIA